MPWLPFVLLGYHRINSTEQNIKHLQTNPSSKKKKKSNSDIPHGPSVNRQFSCFLHSFDNPRLKINQTLQPNRFILVLSVNFQIWDPGCNTDEKISSTVYRKRLLYKTKEQARITFLPLNDELAVRSTVSFLTWGRRCRHRLQR